MLTPPDLGPYAVHSPASADLVRHREPLSLYQRQEASSCVGTACPAPGDSRGEPCDATAWPRGAQPCKILPVIHSRPLWREIGPDWETVFVGVLSMPAAMRE